MSSGEVTFDDAMVYLGECLHCGRNMMRSVVDDGSWAHLINAEWDPVVRCQGGDTVATLKPGTLRWHRKAACTDE